LNISLGLPGDKVAYRRYASLFFVAGISNSDNELITLEIIHRYVEVLDRYFGNVSLRVHFDGDPPAGETILGGTARATSVFVPSAFFH